MKQIIIASNNKKKLKELSEILSSLDIEIISQKDAGFDIEVEETGKSFEENALLKAKTICKALGQPTIADDSGLMVTALNGQPGICSARYAGDGASDQQKTEKLLLNMKDVPKDKREAKFVCVIAFCLPNGKSYTFNGECFGEILYKSCGEGGFGYDPIFYVKQYDKTFAQLDSEIKNKISHRAKALNKFKEFINDF